MSLGPIETRNPARPNDTVSSVQRTNKSILTQQLAAASVAQSKWVMDAPGRARALLGWADALEQASDLPVLVSMEVGKPVREAIQEVKRGVAILRYYSQMAYEPTGEVLPSPDGRGQLLVERNPLGIVLVVAPWNFPVAIPLWKIAPALAYGNAVVFKPASAAAGVASRLMDLGRDHVPSEVLLFAPLSSEEADILVDDANVSGVSFTGSERVGRRIIERTVARGAAIQAEMGGQNPAIVLADAHVASAANQVAAAAMAYAGQKCTATSRIIVLRTIADEFIDALVQTVATLAVGDPSDENTVVGPLISKSARAEVETAITAARSRGAELLAGGSAPDRVGWFYAPSLLLIHDAADPFVQEEIFGPAAAVLVADDEEHAIHLANSTRYGLVAAAYGRDLIRAGRVARRIAAGMLRVNAPTTGVDYYAPFGGERDSSYGPREQGRAAREFYTRTRTILTSTVA